MFTKLNDSDMVQGSRQGPELSDSGLNPINEDQTEYRVKVHNNSDKKMDVPYQQKKKRKHLLMLKMTHNFQKLQIKRAFYLRNLKQKYFYYLKDISNVWIDGSINSSLIICKSILSAIMKDLKREPE